jgi:hypothetical protein
VSAISVPGLHDIPLLDAAWGWRPDDVRSVDHRGRKAVAFAESVDLIAAPEGIQLRDGVLEADVALTGERAFHGLVWRVRDDENYESFYVRPHQVGNPDSVQYNPVWNGVSSWQLYHDEGFWAPVDFPIGDWFTIRIVFAGTRAEVFVGDMATPALEATELKLPAESGAAGLFIGGPGLFVSRFAWSFEPPRFRGPGRPPTPAVPGIVPMWLVSDAFLEPNPLPTKLAPGELDARTWTHLPAEPSGLANLAIVNGIRDGRNTAWARATIHSDRRDVRAMALGFSDRAAVYLNGRALFHGADGYGSRDYRFLGSIGWYDTVFLPLEAGDNDLAIAISEDFGGWGIQARFDDLAGISLG